MGRVKELFYEKREELAERYRKEHPNCDPQDAYDAADREMGNLDRGQD